MNTEKYLEELILDVQERLRAPTGPIARRVLASGEKTSKEWVGKTETFDCYPVVENDTDSQRRGLDIAFQSFAQEEDLLLANLIREHCTTTRVESFPAFISALSGAPKNVVINRCLIPDLMVNLSAYLDFETCREEILKGNLGKILGANIMTCSAEPMEEIVEPGEVWVLPDPNFAGSFIEVKEVDGSYAGSPGGPSDKLYSFELTERVRISIDPKLVRRLLFV